MKGFFKWFKSSTKIKRWMFLILIGIVLLCYAISNLLVIKELEFNQIIKIIISFVLGFVFAIIGIIYIQRRTLEILVEDTNNYNNQNVKSLIFNKNIYNQGPKIVVIGGGSGLNALLKGLKGYTENITAIITLSDYSQSLLSSKNTINTNSLEELKQGIISLARDEDSMSSLMNVKFNSEVSKSLTFGEIFLLAINELNGNLASGIEKTKDILNITGKVLPSTLDEIKICAELEDGTIIEDKDEIPDVVNSKISKISRIYIQPYHSKPAPGVLEAINDADAICFAPGSLYTNIIPNLLIKGITREIKESKALKVYISNLMTEPGQTYNYTLSDHIEAINSHAGNKIIDYCIYDTSEIVPEYIRKYNMEGYELVDQDIQKVKNMGINVIQRPISCVENGFIRHSPEKTAKAIIELICEDLKFKDRQNDFKYLLVNDRLKNNKKISKKNKVKKAVPQKKGLERTPSKFLKKYQSRIDSIQESDIKLKEKEKMKERETLIKMQEKLKKREVKSKTKPLASVGELDENILENETKRKAAARKSVIEEKNASKKQVEISRKSAKPSSAKTKNKIEKLDDKQKKKIVDTIDKLRK